MKKVKTPISLINLGCTKNLVDSQHVLGKFLSLWLGEYYIDPYDSAVELVFVNTCGFISSGRQEALQVINDLKKKGKKICMMGCAVQYRESLQTSENPFQQNEIQTFLELNNDENGQLFSYPRDELNQIFLSDIPRALTNIDQGFEYLKIAEGCDNACAFCIIPQIRGRQHSMPIPKILSEVKNLVAQWTKEIILIAQDSTRYGTDLYGKPQLFELLEQIEQIKGDFSYRVLYLYPDLLTKKQLEKLTHFDKFIPYFDLPFQHISSSILQRMGRYYDEKGIYEILDFIKSHFPTHFIRTNFIVGFPGETDADHQLLKEFIRRDYFDNIALFEYHDEPVSKAFTLTGKVEEKILHQRFLELRQLVNQLLLTRQDAMRNKSQRWWIQDFTDMTVIVRPRLHCPEIDETYEIPFKKLKKTEISDLSIGQKIDLFPF